MYTNNLNKLNKEKKEILNNLSGKQIKFLMKDLSDEFLRSEKESDEALLIESRDYFMEKDVYSAINCMFGLYDSILNKLIVTEIEKETITKKDILLKTFNKMERLERGVDLLKKVIPISKEIDNPKLQEKINSLIKDIYFDISLEYPSYRILINGLKESQEKIINNHETNKELLKENPQLEIDKELIKTYEIYIDVLNVSIDSHDKTFKEFEEIKEKIES